MIKDITPFLATQEEVRTVIQESIDAHPVESFRRYPHGELTSIRRKTSDVMKSCIDGSGHVYLPDEVNPLELAKQFIAEGRYTLTEEIIVAVVCRAMVTPINDMYSAAAGRKSIYIPYRLTSLESLSKKQIKDIATRYIRMVESRKDCKMLRARPYKTYTGEKISF